MTTSLDIAGILKHLPHRYPLLLVDRVHDMVSGEYIHAVKNVSINEPFFVGHFPHYPVMPGVMILEALAQASAILTFHTTQTLPDTDTAYYFVGIDGARFKRPVVPGDQLHLHAKIVRHAHSIWKFSVEAKVSEQMAASAQLMCTVRSIKGNAG